MYRPTAAGYFSGLGGKELGLLQAGVDVIQSVDLDPKATDCMANSSYFSHAILNKDVTKMTVLDQPETDLMCFTWPCTKYSPIADIHNARTGDDLYLHALRHVVLRRPEMFTAENVPGMKKFKVVMETMTKLPDYYVTIFCPVDTENWLPQRRRRLILIATRKPFTPEAPKAADRRPRIKDLLERDPQVHMPEYVISRINGKYRDKPIIVDPETVNMVAPTCVAHYSKDLGTRLVKDRFSKHGLRPFSVREYARLQGFPDDFVIPNELYSYKLIGNAVPPPMGRWIGEQAVKYFNRAA
jgi:DNA (cytosine-5)-methyltransferase 1